MGNKRIKSHHPKLIASLFSHFFAIFLNGCASFRDSQSWQGSNLDSSKDDPILKVGLELAQERQIPANQESPVSFHSSKLALGMQMSEVEKLWGNPEEVEFAGQPRDGNQKWIYYKGFSSPWSLGTLKVIYFEEGKVIGWNTTNR